MAANVYLSRTRLMAQVRPLRGEMRKETFGHDKYASAYAGFQQYNGLFSVALTAKKILTEAHTGSKHGQHATAPAKHVCPSYPPQPGSCRHGA
jgi:hypothetical protein